MYFVWVCEIPSEWQSSCCLPEGLDSPEAFNIYVHHLAGFRCYCNRQRWHLALGQDTEDPLPF